MLGSILFHLLRGARCAGRFQKFIAASIVILASLIAAPAALADTLDWNTRPATNLRTGGTDALTYGTAPAQITVTTSGSATGTFDGAGPNTLAIEPGSTANGTTGYINSTINATVDDESTYHTTTINFTEPVYNVSVIVGDIDGGPTFNLSGAAFNDIVEFRAVNVAGSTILPTSGTPASGLVTWNAGTGRALSTNQNITDGSGNVTVTFAGPIRSFTVRHISGANSTVTNPTQQFIFIETVTYTRSPLLTVQKTSLNGTGTFSFDRSNSLNTGTNPWSSTTTSTSVTTVTAGVAVTGSPGILFATSTATTLTETAPSGWDITSSPVTCTDSNSAVSGNPASFSATVSGLVVTVAAANIRAGANITCAITDNRRPILTLVKTVTNDNGGTQAVSAWTLTATGPTTISGASGSAAVTSASVPTGTYALSESGPAGYTAGSWSCTAGTLVGSNLTLAYGQTATCTINNNDISPVLTLVKTVTNDNGGTQAVSAWTLTATGPTTISGITGAAAVTNANVNAGTYSLSESGPAGYTAGSWSCTAGTLSGSNLTLTPGQTATCTINNNDTAPRLTLVKTVTNDNGGTSAVSAWTLTATGPTTISGVTGAAAITNAAVNAGTYALSESGPAGYTAGSWSCTAGTLVGSNLTLALGQTATCTINNNDISPVLTLVKTVTNDNGGTSAVSAWTLTATGPTTISGITGAAAVTNANVNVGTYALSESGPAGYTAGSWSCTAGTLVGSNLTLALGQTATCTINNNDTAPRLTLVKTVTNDNGGTSVVSAWTLTATGPVTITGITGAAAVTNVAVNVGTYALSESGPAGYTAGSWSCTAGTLVGSNLTLALGQTATCTINNNDIAATLTLVKVIDGDITPSAVSSFTLTATGPTTISGVTGAAAVTNATVSAGSYTLSESGPAGYTFDGWSCTAGTLSGSSLTLPLATTATCTVTNYRIPTFAVQKITTGGVSGPFSFADTGLVGTFSDITTSSAGVATPASPTGLNATFGTAVTISESMSLAWITGGVTCSDANAANTGNTNPVATSATGSVSIPAAANRKGAIITCVFTNAAATPSLAMTKTPDVASVNAAGQTVTYSILVSNTGNTTLGPITVSDALGSVTCPSSGGATVTSLAAGGNETCSFSYAVPQTVLDNNGGGDGDIDNTASSSATYNGSPVNSSANATVALVIAPALVIDKSASTAGPVNANDSYTYTFRVRNTGNVTITGIAVNDIFSGFGVPPVPGSEVMFADAAPLGDSTDSIANGSWDSLAPGDEIEFTAGYTVVQGDIDNP